VQFPDDDRLIDKLVVALIAIAVAIPVTLFVGTLFDEANDVDEPKIQMQMPETVIRKRVYALIFGRKPHKNWHFVDATGKQQVSGILRWWIRYGYEEPVVFIPYHFWRWARRRLRGHPLNLQEPQQVEEHSAANEAEHTREQEVVEARKEAQALHRNRRLLGTIGVLGVYCIWAIFSWFIFAYGMQIYKTLGEDAEATFSRQWGINYAADQASAWKDVLIDAVEVAMLLVILDLLRLNPISLWFEVCARLRCVPQTLLTLHAALHRHLLTAVLALRWRAAGLVAAGLENDQESVAPSER
jgi:hypothetical protein